MANQLYGVDISQFQGTINWSELNNAANFVMIRAAYGTLTDTEFSNNRTQARNMRATAGPLGIGFYYYAYPTLLTADVSARYFVDTVGPLQPGEILALDLEGNVGPTPVAWALDWLEIVEELTGVKPLIYLNQSEVAGYDWAPVVSNGNGLWLADYGMAKDAIMVGSVGAWPIVAMRQWTDSDTVAGVTGAVDGDVFYDDFSEFYEYGLPEPTAPAATPPAPTPETVPPASDTPPVPPATDQPDPTPTTATNEPTIVIQPLPTPVVPVPPVTITATTSTTSSSKPSWFLEWEQELEKDVNWFGTTYGGLVLKSAGLLVGYLSVHTGVIHANDILTSFIGLLAGSTLHDSQK